MTEKQWKALPLPTETPLIMGKMYRGSKVKWKDGKTAYFHVIYN